MNQIAATLAVGVPLLYVSCRPSSATTFNGGTTTTTTATTFSSFRRAVCLSTTFLLLCSIFLLLSSLETCNGTSESSGGASAGLGSGGPPFQPENQTISIALSYAAFVAYSGTYSALMAWSSVELSRASTDINGGVSGRQSMLFGVNGFMALLVASVVQGIVVAIGLSAQAVLVCCVVVLAVGGLFLCVLFVGIVLTRRCGGSSGRRTADRAGSRDVGRESSLRAVLLTGT